MKKIYNYTFKLVCAYILFLSFFMVSNVETKIDNFSSNVHNLNKEKIVASALLIQQHDVEIEEKEESINEVVESVKEEVPKEEKQEEPVKEVPKKPPVENVNLVDTSSYAVLKEETVNMSHYGHDCYGCTSGYTASGYYVGDGRIYYNDSTFGSVRVVAADQKYPLGTILRLGYRGSKITAIVLDRGGGIGDSQRFQIDLLTSSNSEAYQLGIVENTSLEVLRLGY